MTPDEYRAYLQRRPQLCGRQSGALACARWRNHTGDCVDLRGTPTPLPPEPCRPDDAPPYEPEPTADADAACCGELDPITYHPLHRPEPCPVAGCRCAHGPSPYEPEPTAWSRERNDHDAAVDHFAGRVSPFLERVRTRTVPASAYGARAYAR